MGVKEHSRGGLGTPRHLALVRSCLIPKADEGCSQDGSWFAGWIRIPVVAESWAGERLSSTFTQSFVEEVESARAADVGETGRSNM